MRLSLSAPPSSRRDAPKGPFSEAPLGPALDPALEHTPPPGTRTPPLLVLGGHSQEVRR